MLQLHHLELNGCPDQGRQPLNIYTFSFVQNVKYGLPNFVILPDCIMSQEL